MEYLQSLLSRQFMRKPVAVSRLLSLLLSILLLSLLLLLLALSLLILLLSKLLLLLYC